MNSELSNLLKEFSKVVKAEREMEKNKSLWKLYNGINYTIDLYYNDKNKSFEEISLEGYDNMKHIVDTYRGIGHAIGLRRITINLDGEVIQRINFKYANS